MSAPLPAADACLGVGCPKHADCRLYQQSGIALSTWRIATCYSGPAPDGGTSWPLYTSLIPTPTAIGVSSAGVVRAAPALVPVERPWLDGESFAAARARQPQGEITEGGVMRL